MRVYIVTTIRISSAQKRRLAIAHEILQRNAGRKLSLGETVAALAEFALRNRTALAAEGTQRIDEGDPFYDLSIAFDLGVTDGKTHDAILYRRRR